MITSLKQEGFEERVKSFKEMIFQPDQLPQLSEDIRSSDRLHLIHALIGLKKLITQGNIH